ncbi:MAG: DUF3995 domain-containing protein [Aureispira sp.]
MVIFNGVNFTLLSLLGLLHVYWAFGGKWGLDGVIPVLEEGKATFAPGLIMTLAVALALFIGACLHVESLGILSDFYRQIGLLGMGLVFLMRAIGDFNYVGFFKKKRTTVFARRDTLYYAPLCIILAINAFFVSNVLQFL